MKQYLAWEQKKIWQFLMTVIYEEGRNLEQRNPISFSPNEKVSGNFKASSLYQMYLENLHTNTHLSQRIGNIKEAMERKEREFHGEAARRIKRAVEAKLIQEYLDKGGT